MEKRDEIYLFGEGGKQTEILMEAVLITRDIWEHEWDFCSSLPLLFQWKIINSDREWKMGETTSIFRTRMCDVCENRFSTKSFSALQGELEWKENWRAFVILIPKRHFNAPILHQAFVDKRRSINNLAPTQFPVVLNLTITWQFVERFSWV